MQQTLRPRLAALAFAAVTTLATLSGIVALADQSQESAHMSAHMSTQMAQAASAVQQVVVVGHRTPRG